MPHTRPATRTAPVGRPPARTLAEVEEAAGPSLLRRALHQAEQPRKPGGRPPIPRRTGPDARLTPEQRTANKKASEARVQVARSKKLDYPLELGRCPWWYWPTAAQRLTAIEHKLASEPGFGRPHQPARLPHAEKPTQ